MRGYRFVVRRVMCRYSRTQAEAFMAGSQTFSSSYLHYRHAETC